MQIFLLNRVTPRDHLRLLLQKWGVIRLEYRGLDRTEQSLGVTAMSEIRETAYTIKLSRIAGESARDGAVAIERIRGDVNAKKEYVRFVSAIQCDCKDCNGACCTSHSKNCNASSMACVSLIERLPNLKPLTKPLYEKA